MSRFSRTPRASRSIRGQTSCSSPSARQARSELRIVDPRDPSTWTIETLAAAIDGTNFGAPSGLAVDPLHGVLYVADSGRHVVRCIRVDDLREVARIGHIDEPGPFGSDGAVADLYLEAPEALALAPDGSLYVADTGNHRVLRIGVPTSATSSVSRVLGDGSASSGGNGAPSRHFPVKAPRGLTLDSFGNLFVTATDAVRVVSVGADGIPDGDDAVHTIYGLPRDRFPMSVTRCLTGIHAATDSRVYVLDSCLGFMLALERR